MRKPPSKALGPLHPQAYRQLVRQLTQANPPAAAKVIHLHQPQGPGSAAGTPAPPPAVPVADRAAIIMGQW